MTLIVTKLLFSVFIVSDALESSNVMPVCGLLLYLCSIGSKCEYQFEEDIYNIFGVQTHTFDPFLAPVNVTVMSNLPFVHYYPIGLAGISKVPELKKKFPYKKFLTLQQMMVTTKLDFIDVLKVDCEGCEYAVISDLLRLHKEDRAPPFGQLAIEIHR